jgi:hypothetical protein
MKFFRLFLFWSITLFVLGLTNRSEGATKIAPPTDYLPIYNFQNDWLVYSYDYKNYVPYSQKLNESTKSLSLQIDLLKNKNYYLFIHSNSDSYLFLEGTLQSNIKPKQWMRLRIDSLHQALKKDVILLTIHGEGGVSGNTVLLCNQKANNPLALTQDIPSSSTLINIKPINFTVFGNLTAIVIMLILMLNAWLYNIASPSYLKLINPKTFFNKDIREHLTNINKPTSSMIGTTVLIVSMLIAYIFLSFISVDSSSKFRDSILPDQSDTLELLKRYFILSGVIFILSYLKYLLIYIIGNMFNFRHISDIIFMKITQASYLFYVALLLIFLLVNLNYPSITPDLVIYFTYLTIMYYIIRFILLYVVTTPSSSFINLYLFSYLCVIEIIPLIIGIKFIL